MARLASPGPRMFVQRGAERAEFGSSSQHTRPITGSGRTSALHPARPCLAVCMSVVTDPHDAGTPSAFSFLACETGRSALRNRHLFPGNNVVEDISQKLLQAHLVDETALQ